MKGLSFINKIVFLVNSLAAFLLLLSYLLPYVSPKQFGFVSVLSLGVPFLLIINLLFFLYWLFQVKKQMLLSLIALLLSYSYVNLMYKFKASKLVEDSGNFTVMTYNVRLFNEYRWLPNKNVKEDIVDFIYNEQPDILCLQEYTRGKPVRLKGYNRYNATYTKEVKGGQCIYSKFPIVNSGSLEFPNSTNNALFVDVVKNKDTIRVYNVHLQSSGINTKIEALKKESSEHLFKRISSTFKAQQNQAELLLKHMSATNYKTIIAGDFNNTAYSYVYKELRGDYKDAFEEAGNGFGRTYDFKFFPVRIDFILVDEAFEVNAFKTYEKRLSDHYPIKATLKLH